MYYVYMLDDNRWPFVLVKESHCITGAGVLVA